jgi:hypothetical protein
MPRFLVAAPLFLLSLIAMGQESAPEPVHVTALANYNHFELRPVEIFADKVNRDVVAKFRLELAKQFDPILAQWNITGSTLQDKRSAAIKVTLGDMRFASGRKRFWIGPLAGSSYMKAKLVVDVSTGQAIAYEDFTSNAGAMAGTVTIGGTDNRMISNLAQKITAYVVGMHAYSTQ